jgi:hypothetical protein
MSKQDPTRRKNSFLYVIQYDISLIKDQLVAMQKLIKKYNTDPKPESWKEVKDYATPTKDETAELRKCIHRHFRTIGNLIKNPRLDPARFDANYISYTVMLLDDALRIDPQYGQQDLWHLVSNIEEQIQNLDGGLDLLEREMA